MTLIQPNLTSNLPAVSRVDIVARQNPAPKRAVVGYSDTARTRSMEEAMLAAMADTIAAWKDAHGPAETRNTLAAKAVLDAMDEPSTAKQIAERLMKSENNILGILKRLEEQHRVEVVEVGRFGARIWGRTAGAYAESNGVAAKKAQGEKTRRAILAAMAHPMQPRQIAKASGIKFCTVREHLRVMAFEGLVVAEGGGGSVAATYRRVTK